MTPRDAMVEMAVLAPVVLVHIREGVVGGQVVVPDVLIEEPEEDGGHLSPGDVGVGPDGAVSVALDVGVVIVAVQHGGHGGLLPAGEDSLGPVTWSLSSSSTRMVRLRSSYQPVKR